MPAFHGYGNSIAGALRRAGHEVTVHPYDSNARLSDKVRTKVLHELPGRLGSPSGDRARRQMLTDRAVEALRGSRPDVVITVKGDALGQGYWEAVDRSGAQQLLWLYDELARMSFDESVIASRPSIVSYSPHDVSALETRGLRAGHVLDAFDHTIPFSPVPSDDVVFVGARYPDRTRILTGLHARGIPVRAYGRDWSHHPVDRLRTWQLARPDLPAERDVDRATAYGVTAGAVAALNSHTDQDGFTMRTYELPGTGSLQLIDRPDVDQLYEPGREVLVFSGLDELAELCERARSDRAWARDIAERGRVRTLAEHTFDHRVPVLEAAWA
ncbi:spore maturation protein CgeB [Nocardioides sp. BE266]|uniref:CgeB family protein n=1 Tax=Nocardioides sp. BE266 TaxID=2817725 RepID=UPI0028549128|nr:glycosyltransferase [Nocardioides sp. BE266]MDR7252130.1 spore maturation protein CgeB [Nocardioides sp. BE266]